MLFYYFFFFFLIVDFSFLIPAAAAQVFNPIAELALPTGISSNEANWNTSSNCRSYNKKSFNII